MAEKENKIKEQLKTAVTENVPQIYFNSYSFLMSGIDFAITLERNGFPTAVLNVPFSMAKDLCENLLAHVDLLEKKIETKIVGANDVVSTYSKGTE